MKSFALWFETHLSKQAKKKQSKGNIETKVETDVHFNLWHISHKECERPVLDVGILVKNPVKLESLYFYLPFETKYDDINDLGKLLENPVLASSLFNNNCKVISFSSNKEIKISSEGQTISVYKLDVETDIELTSKYGGTVLKIGRPKQFANSANSVYFRFRVTSNELNQLFYRYKPSNAILESAFSVEELLDFRFNDYRSLDNSLLEHMLLAGKYATGKIHFLYMCDADDEISFIGDNLSARTIEPKIWESYYPEIKDCQIIAYHMRRKFIEETGDPIDGESFFLKVSYHVCNKKTIAIYLGIVFLISFLASLVAGVFL